MHRTCQGPCKNLLSTKRRLAWSFRPLGFSDRHLRGPAGWPACTAGALMVHPRRDRAGGESQPGGVGWGGAAKRPWGGGAHGCCGGEACRTASRHPARGPGGQPQPAPRAGAAGQEQRGPQWQQQSPQPLHPRWPHQQTGWRAGRGPGLPQPRCHTEHPPGHAGFAGSRGSGHRPWWCRHAAQTPLAGRTPCCAPHPLPGQRSGPSHPGSSRRQQPLAGPPAALAVWQHRAWGCQPGGAVGSPQGHRAC